MRVDPDSARVSFPPPLVYLGTLLLGLAIGSLLGRPGIGLPPVAGAAIGAALAVSGFVLTLSAAGLFRRSGTEVKPWLPSTKLVVAGLYRFTRNPMYLGMTTVYLGLAIALDSLAALVLILPLIAVIQTQVIAREERYLEGRFGQPYRDYKARVRRWL